MQTSRQTAGVSYVQALPAGMEAAGSCSTVLPHLVIRPPCPPAPEGTLHSTLLQVLLTEVRTLNPTSQDLTQGQPASLSGHHGCLEAPWSEVPDRAADDFRIYERHSLVAQPRRSEVLAGPELVTSQPCMQPGISV